MRTEHTLMDSPEALEHALCSLVPEMVHGFRVVTPSGEIFVPAQEAHPFVLTMEVMLMRQIRRLQNQSALRQVAAPQPVNTGVKACDGETLRDLARKIAARIG